MAFTSFTSSSSSSSSSSSIINLLPSNSTNSSLLSSLSTSSSTSLTKAERRELKRLQNLEWKWKRGGEEEDANSRYTEYYQRQLPNIFQDWSNIREVIAKDLPVTFRLCTLRDLSVCNYLKSRFLTEFHQMRGRFTSVKGNIINEVVIPIEWCKDSWQINCDSATLAKDSAFSSLYSLLCREVKLGHIVRQELVSMIPAILLDPQPYHYVLDMCAAPGSKTEQLISKVCHNSSYEITSGLVVANDADPKRLATLRQRYISCRYPNLIYTCATAEDLHSLLKPYISFDRIICDVPCTGDGTFRKSPHLWRLFRPRFAVEIHPLQLDIVRRSLDLMKTAHSNGKSCRLIYSTCSLNPIEDEAVVSALLIESWKNEVNLQLVDPLLLTLSSSNSSDNNNNNNNNISLLQKYLPGIRWRNGINTWSCDIETMLLGENDPIEREQSRERMPSFTQSMFCPQSNEMKDALHLERCMRIVPHDMNTGGFFIAILEISPNPLSNEQLIALESESILTSSIISTSTSTKPTNSKKRKIIDSNNLINDESLTKEKKKRSMNAFQQLGYNPHTAPKINEIYSSTKLREWKISSEAFTYTRLLSNEVRIQLHPYGFNLPNNIDDKYSLFLEEEMIISEIQKSDTKKKSNTDSNNNKTKTKSKHQSTYHLSIFSPNVANLMESIGINSGLITQAGVRVINFDSIIKSRRVIVNKSNIHQNINEDIVHEYGGPWAINLLGGIKINVEKDVFESILEKKSNFNENNELRNLLVGNYALIITSWNENNLNKNENKNKNEIIETKGKRRLSKAEKKKIKLLGNNSNNSHNSHSNNSNNNLEEEEKEINEEECNEINLSIVIKKLKQKEEEEEVSYLVISSNDKIDSYLDILHSNSKFFKLI